MRPEPALVKKRGQLGIIALILEATMRGQRKTQIMYDARIDFRTLDKYLEYLVTKGLLQHSGPTYKATDKGKQFLERYGEAQRILES